jgi:hypothetical protein
MHLILKILTIRAIRRFKLYAKGSDTLNPVIREGCGAKGFRVELSIARGAVLAVSGAARLRIDSILTIDPFVTTLTKVKILLEAILTIGIVPVRVRIVIIHRFATGVAIGKLRIVARFAIGRITDTMHIVPVDRIIARIAMVVIIVITRLTDVLVITGRTNNIVTSDFGVAIVAGGKRVAVARIAPIVAIVRRPTGLTTAPIAIIGNIVRWHCWRSN